MDARKKAEILFCLDYLMNGLNDEEAVYHWYEVGVPDGTGTEKITDSQVQPYEELEVCDDDFYYMVRSAVRTLGSQIFGASAFWGRTGDALGVFY